VLEEADIKLYDVKPELSQLKSMLVRRKDLHKMKWSTVWALYEELAPNFLKLIDLLLTLPAHSADCERGFSRLKQVKTVYRSRLRDDRVTDILTIVLETPAVELFDPVPAITLWHQAGSRKMHAVPSPPDEAEESEDEDFVEEYVRSALKRIEAMESEMDSDC